jgi:hypothetical protein
MRPSFSQQLRHGGLLDVHTYTALNNSERQLDSIFKEVKSPRRVELRENEITSYITASSFPGSFASYSLE